MLLVCGVFGYLVVLVVWIGCDLIYFGFWLFKGCMFDLDLLILFIVDFCLCSFCFLVLFALPGFVGLILFSFLCFVGGCFRWILVFYL